MGDQPKFKDGHQFHNTQALEFLKERFTAEDRASEAAAARASLGASATERTLPPQHRNKKTNIFFVNTARQRTWASEAFKDHDERRGPIPGADRTAAAMRESVEAHMKNLDGSAAFPEASARAAPADVFWAGKKMPGSESGPGMLGAYDLSERERGLGGGALSTRRENAAAASTARSAMTFSSELGPDVLELQRKKAEIESQLGELERVIAYKEKREIQKGLGRPMRPFAMLPQHS